MLQALIIVGTYCDLYAVFEFLSKNLGIVLRKDIWRCWRKNFFKSAQSLQLQSLQIIPFICYFISLNLPGSLYKLRLGQLVPSVLADHVRSSERMANVCILPFQVSPEMVNGVYMWASVELLKDSLSESQAISVMVLQIELGAVFLVLWMTLKHTWRVNMTEVSASRTCMWQ